MAAFRGPRLVAVLAAASLLLGACGEDEVADTAPDTPAESPTDGGEATPEDDAGALTTIDLEAENIAFSQDTIQVPPGEQITVEFTNHDSVPHNFAVYQSEDAQQDIFVGETITGPDQTTTYEFTSPDKPGTYFFRCDVHPEEMTGEVIVF